MCVSQRLVIPYVWGVAGRWLFRDEVSEYQCSDTQQREELYERQL